MPTPHIRFERPSGPAFIPRDVDWYADPSGANEIAELRCAGFTINKGVNALALGIAARRTEAGPETEG